jgi:molybdopterin-containing oxidoreductase family iron-sulfur binding subunit
VKAHFTINRRSLLKATGAVALGLLPLGSILVRASGKQDPKSLLAKSWAMAVDTRKCPEGCRICITACHQAHNVPDIGNPKEEVKWIWTDTYAGAFPELSHAYVDDDVKKRPFHLLCNHCANPTCVKVCPTQATFQRPDGIVMMDYHRCIGCRYCMTGCPYGARSLNFNEPREFLKEINPKYPTRVKGVVEKCNFCEERLAVGQRPHCVEACPYQALTFGDITDPNSEIRKLLKEHPSQQRKLNFGTKPKVYYII